MGQEPNKETGIDRMTPNQFKAKRKALGFTQAELAEEWGVHVQSISEWERGVHPIGQLAALAFLIMEFEATHTDPPLIH